MPPRLPGYWMNETSGVLRPAVEAYLTGLDLSLEQISALRAYFRQWMTGSFIGPDAEALRGAVDGIATRQDIDVWLNLADAAGIDPL